MPKSVPQPITTSGNDHDFDFVLLDLTNSIDEIHSLRVIATPVSPISSAVRTHYVVRRIEHWNKKYVSDELRIAATSLPLGPQAVVRREMLLVLGLQLFGVFFVVSLATCYQPVRDQIVSSFDENGSILLVVSAILAVVLIGGLNVQSARHCVNVGLLLLFSGAQIVIVVGLSAAGSSHVGLFHCGAILAWVLFMILLSGYRVKDNGDKRLIPSRHLISPLVAGAMSSAAVVCVSCLLFITYGDRFMSGPAFGFSVIFQLSFLTWCSWDVSCMLEVVAADEFAYSVIFFYTDIILSLVLFFSAFCVALGFSSLSVLLLAPEDDATCLNCIAICCISQPRPKSQPAASPPLSESKTFAPKHTNDVRPIDRV